MENKNLLLKCHLSNMIKEIESLEAQVNWLEKRMDDMIEVF
jgi:hypothetical protein